MPPWLLREGPRCSPLAPDGWEVKTMVLNMLPFASYQASHGAPPPIISVGVHGRNSKIKAAAVLHTSGMNSTHPY